ncbi:MAG: transcriptional regulator [Treponema sp.]|mgnify:CR=1 FL=1|nr:transcriptional regulator [Treponema sp.]
MNILIQQMSKENFEKARTQATFNELIQFITNDDTSLMSFNEIKKLLKPKNEIYLGMKIVAIDDIVGSEGRYKDFDSKFFPKNNHLKHRWEKINQAHLTDTVLPPIRLYEIAGLYFVNDGNHRVSVAKAQGVEYIDAEVISLKSEIKIKPRSNQKQILKQVIAYEKRVFYNETFFGDITNCWDLDFSSAGQYDVILQHIKLHKYYINEPLDHEISQEEAILSWYKNVYSPIINQIEKRKIMKHFKKRTKSDLYVWIVKFWDDLKNKYGQDFNLCAAINTFEENTKEPFWRKILKKIKIKP